MSLSCPKYPNDSERLVGAVDAVDRGVSLSPLLPLDPVKVGLSVGPYAFPLLRELISPTSENVKRECARLLGLYSDALRNGAKRFRVDNDPPLRGDGDDPLTLPLLSQRRSRESFVAGAALL